MPPRRKLSTMDRGRAVGWHQEGISAREIARRLGVSDSVIRRLLERFQATGSTDERPRSGRPRCTTRRQDLLMQVTALRQRTTNASRLRTELRRAANINVSRQTIRNRLHEFNLRSRAAAIRVPLTQVHRQARRTWCRLHLRWTSLGTVSATMMPESASGGVQESALLMLVFANTIVMEEGR